MIIKLTIPAKLENFLRDELKVEPATYFQNEVMKPLLDKYENTTTDTEVEKAKVEIKKEITKTKNDVKIEEVNK